MTESDALTPEALSALVDGEADAGDAAAASARWRDDAGLRAGLNVHDGQVTHPALRESLAEGR